MFQPALRIASTGVKPLSAPLRRAFTTVSPLNCKARIGQILEQAQSVLPKAYKTVKTTSQSGDGAVRRNQLIWLVKSSLGKNVAVAKKPSPHERLWDTSRPRAGGPKGHASWEGPTVWPHLW